MQMTAHELQELHELTLSCVNSITCMGMFFNHAKDPELKAMIQRHFPLHVQDYNKKVSYLTDGSVSQEPFPVPDLNATLDSNVLIPKAGEPVTPRTAAQTLTDREIATSYLLTLKRAGREYAWAAMEMSDPNLRTFLEDAFRMCSRHAYDVWQWMVKRGYYPLEPAPQRANQMLGAMYNLVPEQQHMFS